MGLFAMNAGSPYLYYVGTLKNFPGGSGYSQPSGFLMKIAATPGNYGSETCGTYTVTTLISDVISSDVKYTRTADQTKVIIYTTSKLTISASS